MSLTDTSSSPQRNSRDRQHVCPCSASECWRRLLITLRLVLILTGKFHTPASQFAGTTGPTLPNARTLLQVVPTPRLLPDTDGSSCIIPGAVSTGAAVFLWNRPADAPTSARHNQQAAPQAASPVMVSHAGPGAPDWGIPAMRLGYPHLLSGPGRPCFHRSTSLIAHPSPRTGNDRLGGCFASGSGRNAALHVAVEGRWRDVARVHGPAARAQSREGAQNWPAQVQEGAGPAFEDTVVCWRDAGGIRGARRHRHNPKASLVPPRMFAAARVTGGQGCMRSRGHSGARAPRTCTRARFAGSCAQSEALHCSLKARGRRDAAGCVTGSRGLVLACCRRCCPPPKFA